MIFLCVMKNILSQTWDGKCLCFVSVVINVMTETGAGYCLIFSLHKKIRISNVILVNLKGTCFGIFT
jgi:hypothetical protein